jgi:hypothetical protein
VDEATWLACTDAKAMLAFLRGKASDRKLRLFAAACCRVAWSSLGPHRSRRAVEVAERYADGLATEQDLHRARSQACEATMRNRRHTLGRAAGSFSATVEGRLNLAAEAVHFHQPFLIGRFRWHTADDELNTATPLLLRDLFGPLPLRPVAVAAALLQWREGLVVRLAQAAYDNRRLPAGTLEPERLAILADALEEVGCTESELLEHLRGAGPHVRGCWAVDLVLGRS